MIKSSAYAFGGLTVHFEDKAYILGVPRLVFHGHHVVSAVLKPQVRQAHGAVVAGPHSDAVVLGDVGEHPWLPCPNGAAHRSGHKGPMYGGDSGARHVHREEDILLHRPDQVPLGGVDGDRSSCKTRCGDRFKSEALQQDSSPKFAQRSEFFPSRQARCFPKIKLNNCIPIY